MLDYRANLACGNVLVDSNGAGSETRTRTAWLEARGSTFELCLQIWG